VTVKLQWASYYDAADQSALSRIWGGIHPGQDDLPSRQMGSAIGTEAFEFAKRLFRGEAGDCRGNDNFDSDADGLCDASDFCPDTTPPGGCECTNGYCCRAGCMLGDSDDNGLRNLADLRDFANCFSGPHENAGFVGPDTGCRFFFDIDSDGDIDADDAVLMSLDLTGP
jgi:hypothetical protein